MTPCKSGAMPRKSWELWCLLQRLKILNTISSLKDLLFLDFYDLFVGLVKRCAHLIVLPFIDVVNRLGLMKISRVILVHKHSTTSDLDNYRPISAVPVFGQLLMNTRMSRFVDEYSVLSEYQFEFLKRRNMKNAMGQLLTNRRIGKYKACLCTDVSCMQKLID